MSNRQPNSVNKTTPLVGIARLAVLSGWALVSSISAASTAVPPASQPPPLHQRIVDSVQDYVRLMVDERADTTAISDLQISVHSIDTQLRLQNCDRALTVSANPNQRLPGKAMIKVACPVEPGWSLYVPTTVSWQQDVVLSAVALQRGEELTADKVYVQRLQLKRANVSYVSSTEQLLGKVTKRRLAANKPIDWRFLDQANLVHKGDSVVLEARSGAIAIKFEGKALSSGAIGERIRVQNQRSKRIVDARVIAKGKAEVIL